MTINPVRLNHAVLFVGDLERSINFYAQAFAMTVMAREPRANAAFLRLPRSGNHHDLGLFGVGAQPPRPRGSIGLYHLAWQVDTVEELRHARETLLDLDAFTDESSHGATKSVYGQDPDGNEFEVNGCFLAPAGVSSRTPHPWSGSTWTLRWPAGAGCARHPSSSRATLAESRPKGLRQACRY